MNEWYAKDISKKTPERQQNERKSWCSAVTVALWLYQKTERSPFWVIDLETAGVLDLYRMALDGYGLAETAAALEQDGVLNPTYYMGPYHH